MKEWVLIPLLQYRVQVTQEQNQLLSPRTPQIGENSCSIQAIRLS